MTQEINKLEHRKLRIKILAPVHIGSGEKLLAKEYLLDEKNKQILFLNKRAWQRFIFAKDLFDKYTDYMQQPNNPQNPGINLTKWLQNHRYKLEDVQDRVSNRVYVELAAGKLSANEIALHIKQVDGTVYLPGSSIKGYIRTAILYHLLKKDKVTSAKYWVKVKENLRPGSRAGDVKKNLPKFDESVEQELLHKLTKNLKRPNDAVNSVMQGLLVGDALPIGKAQTALLQKWDQHARGDDPKPMPVFRECILPGAIFACDVKLDYAMLEKIGINSFADLQKILQEFYAFIMQRWQGVFGKFSQGAFLNSKGGNMFLGGGTGFLTKTILSALAPNEAEELQMDRILLDILFPKGGHKKDRVISPHTLKLVQYKQKEYIQGIVEVSMDV